MASWKYLVLMLFGYPSLLRRIQAPVLLRMLELDCRKTVLDAGCGGGFFASEIGKKSKLSVGVDTNLKRGLSSILGKRPRVNYSVTDVKQLPFGDELFDRVLLSSVLQIVNNDRLLLKECRRILKPNGLLVLSVTVGYRYIGKLNDFKSQINNDAGVCGAGYYSPNEVTALLHSEGFQIIETEYSPKRLGSFVFEVELYLWCRLRIPSLSSFLFPLFYPIAYFEKFANAKQKGDELIIKAQKVSN